MLIVPSDLYDEEKEYLELHLGGIEVESNLLDYEEDKDYKEETNPELLYDTYPLTFKGFDASLTSGDGSEKT